MFLHLRLPVLNDIIDLRYNIGFGNAPNDFRLPPAAHRGASRQFTSGRLIFREHIYGGSTHVQKNCRRSSCAHYAAELFCLRHARRKRGRGFDPVAKSDPAPERGRYRTAHSDGFRDRIQKVFDQTLFQGQRPSSRAVLHDDDRISISANELVYIDDFCRAEAYGGKNKSADDLLVSDVSIYVNDCLVEVDFRHKFAAGKAEDFSLYMPILDMMLYGIREIYSIDIEFRIAAASGEILYGACPPVRRFAQPREPGAYDYSGYIAGDIAQAIHYDKLNAFNDSHGF